MNTNHRNKNGFKIQIVRLVLASHSSQTENLCFEFLNKFNSFSSSIRINLKKTKFHVFFPFLCGIRRFKRHNDSIQTCFYENNNKKESESN